MPSNYHKWPAETHANIADLFKSCQTLKADWKVEGKRAPLAGILMRGNPKVVQDVKTSFALLKLLGGDAGSIFQHPIKVW